MIDFEILRNFAGVMVVLSIFPFFIINIYLSVRLRKNKRTMMIDILRNAPFKFRERAKFMLEVNMSWIFASSAMYLWFGYLMLRFMWKIPSDEMYCWHLNIKKTYGKYFGALFLSALLANIWMSFFPIFILFTYV